MAQADEQTSLPRWVKVSGLIVAIAVLLFVVVLVLGGGSGRHGPSRHFGGQGANTSRVTDSQADVAARGSLVMPFDLDRSTHAFEPLPSGGTQTVVSKDGALDQVALIREHLEEEAAAFAAGDYGSPASIHGADMPGLSELTGSVGRLRVTYEPIPRGGRIRFASAEPRLVKAIHRWFDAQVSDHGVHASQGPPNG